MRRLQLMHVTARSGAPDAANVQPMHETIDSMHLLHRNHHSGCKSVAYMQPMQTPGSRAGDQASS
jgi:hypothetical protein